MLTTAIVRPPGPTFAEGLTTADVGAPDVARAVVQHEAYCQALEHAGLAVIRLDADPAHPDSPFVEDTVVLSRTIAVLARPGAHQRRGEVHAIEPEIARRFASVRRIEPPGTLDGGDVCDCEDRVLIGVSARTNEDGAHQLAGFLADEGRTVACLDLREVDQLLHLKSGVSYLGDGRLAVAPALADRDELRGYEHVRVAPAEACAANAVRVNDRVLIAAGSPQLERTLIDLAYSVVVVDISEFRKMDGGLSCLSLRF